MSVDYIQTDGIRRRQRTYMSYLIWPMLAFLLGLLLMGWLISRWEKGAAYLGLTPAPPTVVQPARPPLRPAPPAPTTAVSLPQGTTQRLVIDPEISRRVTQIEQRIAFISSQSQAAVGNADRAEGLLVAFAARRALDRGVALGYIEGLLRERFGTSQPVAVATVISASRQPVTLEELQTGLQEIGPELSGAGPDQDWWTALKAELGELVIVRRSGTPSTLPAERLQRAKRRLDAGQVDVALAEVLRMPGREGAADWIGDARRYVSARRALDTIETAALLDPRNPPDAPLAQPVPAPAGPRSS